MRRISTSSPCSTHGARTALLAALATLGAAVPARGDTPTPGDLGPAMERALSETGLDPVWQVGTPFDGVAAAWQAPNRARGLRAWFLLGGPRLVPFEGESRDGPALGLRLRGLRRGPARGTLEPVRPERAPGRIEYVRPALTEWYANGAGGLQQGFDLAERPLNAAAGELELELELTGGLALEALRTDGYALADADGRFRVRVSGLRAWDADEVELACRFERRPAGVAIVVDDRGARYPLVIDPTFVGEEAKLVPTRTPGAGARSVALFGNRAVVGGGAEAVYVLQRGGDGQWGIETKLAPDEDTDTFGDDIAAFDEWIAVGAAGYGGFLGTGAVFIYRLDDQTDLWEQWTRVDPPGTGTSFREFGRQVELDDDFLIVSDPLRESSVAQTGAVAVYRVLGTSFPVSQLLLPPLDVDVFARFGTGVALRGERLAIGAPGDGPNGRVRLYELNDTDEFVTAGTLTTSVTEDLGYSVALAGDFLLAGSPSTDSARGSAVLFERVGSSWVEQVHLAGSEEGEQYGGRVAMRALGATGLRALVSASRSDAQTLQGGRVELLEGSGLGLTLVDVLLQPPGGTSNHALLGSCVALGPDYALAGAANQAGGRLHVYEQQAASWEHVQAFSGRYLDPGDLLGCDVALAGEHAVVGARLDDDGRLEGGLAHVFRRTAGTWEHLWTLLAPDPAVGANYGTAVAASTDAERIVVGAPAMDGHGLAFVHHRTFLGWSWGVGELLEPPDGGFETRFGDAVAVSLELALVGAPHADAPENDSGAAYLFRSSFGGWDFEQKLTDPAAFSADDLGRAVAIVSADEVLVGAPGADLVGFNAGKVLRYRYDGASWQLDQVLAPPGIDPAGRFGTALAVSGDRLAVGEPGNSVGRVWLFRLVGGSWQLESTVEGEPGHGSRVDLDGALLGVGGEDRAWAYHELGGVWLPSELVPADGPILSFQQATPVAVSGSALLAGADADFEHGSLAGAAYVFRPDPPEPIQPFGFGDGSGPPCPCGNESPAGGGAGCLNSTGVGGLLSASGSSSLSTDDLELEAAGMRPGSPCVLFVGDAAGAGTAFGDGLRFVFGETHRVDGAHAADAGGRATWSGLHDFGLWEECDLRHFQVFYRDAAPGGSPCGEGFNLTNGLRVVFLP